MTRAVDVEAVRARCPHGCSGWPKPCSYCEGYGDAADAASDEISSLRAALWRVVETDQSDYPALARISAFAAARALLADSRRR